MTANPSSIARLALAVSLAAMLLAPASAQVQRNFPQQALRGALVVGMPPEVQLNGRAAMLAPGARLRGQNNMLQVSAALSGSRLLVNYTVDSSGLVKDVWILTPEEAAVRPWPTTSEQSRAWSFDPVAQMWSKP